MNEVFNTPFELGVRMVYLLMALYPRKVDLQRLVYFDYAAIYSADLNGPESLHTPVPLRGGEYTSRREVIEEGLYLMAQRSFVDVEAGEAVRAPRGTDADYKPTSVGFLMGFMHGLSAQ